MLDEKRYLQLTVSMLNFKKITALVLLGLFTLILAGTGTGLHVHHGSHDLEVSTVTDTPHDDKNTRCAQHCEGEPLFEHFLENHGSFYTCKVQTFRPSLAAVMHILPVSLTDKNAAPKPRVNQEILPGHQHHSSTAPGRAPPFSA